MLAHNSPAPRRCAASRTRPKNYDAGRRYGPPRDASRLHGLAICGRSGGRMTVHDYISHVQVVPEYRRQREGIQHATRICQRIVGALSTDGRPGARPHPSTAGGGARYEAELAHRRYVCGNPGNRQLTGSLEADWSNKRRALAADPRRLRPSAWWRSSILRDEYRKQGMVPVADFLRPWRAAATRNANAYAWSACSRKTCRC
jgi:hypothetical protein